MFAKKLDLNISKNHPVERFKFEKKILSKNFMRWTKKNNNLVIFENFGKFLSLDGTLLS